MCFLLNITSNLNKREKNNLAQLIYHTVMGKCLTVQFVLEFQNIMRL